MGSDCLLDSGPKIEFGSNIEFGKGNNGLGSIEFGKKAPLPLDVTGIGIGMMSGLGPELEPVLEHMVLVRTEQELERMQALLLNIVAEPLVGSRHIGALIIQPSRSHMIASNFRTDEVRVFFCAVWRQDGN